MPRRLDRCDDLVEQFGIRLRHTPQGNGDPARQGPKAGADGLVRPGARPGPGPSAELFVQHDRRLEPALDVLLQQPGGQGLQFLGHRALVVSST